MYVDNIISISCNAREILEEIQSTFKFKNGKIEVPDCRVLLVISTAAARKIDLNLLPWCQIAKEIFQRFSVLDNF